MLETRHLRLALCNTSLLRDYLNGEPPDWHSVRRQLFLSERRLEIRKPDHFHRLAQEFNLRDIDSIAGLLHIGLPRLVGNFLVYRNGMFNVLREHFETWQELITRMSPVVLTSCAIAAKHNFPSDPASLNRMQAMDYIRRYIHPQLGMSTLVTVREPMVEDMIAREGLADLHVHLNGSTEMDKIWLRALLRPDPLFKALSQGFREPATREQYEQIAPGLTPAAIRLNLRAARRLRIVMCLDLFDPDSSRTRKPIRLTMYADLVHALKHREFDAEHHLQRHPVRHYFSLPPSVSEEECEAFWLICALKKLERTHSEDFAQALHCYLLIQGAQFIPIGVQQIEQFGFDQFQKITFSQVREDAEVEYLDRFRQAAYLPHRSDLWLLEGRFSPSNSAKSSANTLARILAGFQRYHRHAPAITASDERTDIQGSLDLRRTIERALMDSPALPGILKGLPDAIERGPDRLDLRLVGHFIKKDELVQPGGKRCRVCRFYLLRNDLRRRARGLVFLRQRYSRLRHYVTGLDAAANELHTPPEVFASVFRYARRNGIRYFTFHVGEDYNHLLSGMRAISEALEFLDLRDGDRMGHCTAIGIAPELWLREMPARMVIRAGEWLDNLVFARHMLLTLPGGAEEIQKIETEILALARRIYGKSHETAYLFHDLRHAWQLRDRDPLLVLDPELDERCMLDEEDQAERERIRQGRNSGEGEASPAAWALYRAYHQHDVTRRWLEPVPVDTAIVSAKRLREMQDHLIRSTIDKRVAIETMPTSNVRISYYDKYAEHHILRWLGIIGNGPCPTLCIASDDPGIFATNLRNEFMHVFRILTEVGGLTPEQALAHLQKLNSNSRIYAFIDR